jgi:large subunit ribosomal protein L10
VRSELLKHGARFSVVKNTLTRRAAEEAGVPQLVELLDGPTAIAFVREGDMVAVAKSLNDTARLTKILSLKGGILQGEPMSADQVRSLAALPPTDVLQGQVLGAIVGPLSAIVALFTAPLRDLVAVIDARIEQLGGAGTPEVEEQPQPVEEDQSGSEENKQDEGAEEKASEPEGKEDGN